MGRRTRFILAVTAVLAATARPAPAQPIVPITDPMPEAGARLGQSVATLPGKVVVSAAGHASGSGIAYVFDVQTGAVLQTLQNPTPAPGDLFGWSVAASGNNVLVGTWVPAGEAHLFDATTGALLRTFAAPSIDVDLQGNNVLAGYAPVTLFDATTGATLNTFASPVGGTDGFGNSVALVGPNVLVGAPFDDTAGPDAGAAYLFDGSTGMLLLSIPNPSPGTTTWFGWDVAAVGDDLLVSAPGVGGQAAYLIDGDTGTLLHTFSVMPFGIAALGPDVVITGFERGYVFSGATGALLRTFSSPSHQYLEQVAAGDGRVIAAAVTAYAGATEAGAAYVFCAAACGPCETCGPTGGCVPAPHAVCRQMQDGRGMRLVLRDAASDAADAAIWKGSGRWTGVSDTQLVARDFGDPTDANGQDYALCVWDESGPPTLLFHMTVPAAGTCGTSPCWRATQPSSAVVGGYRYRDSDAASEGVKVISLRTARGTIALQVIGRGANLSNRPFGLPPLPLPLPLRVQLQATDGTCLESTYSVATANTTARFQARSD